MRDEAGNAGTAAAPAGSSVAQGQSQLHPESEASIGSARLSDEPEGSRSQAACLFWQGGGDTETRFLCVELVVLEFDL